MADEGGFDSLSMRKIAGALGVEAMSLYNHVKNKDDILDGMVEIVVGEIEVPALGGDWKQTMRKRALDAHAVLMRHPWATMLLMSRMNVGPAMLRYIDATIGCLREGGFSYPMADRAWNTLDAYVYGFTLQRLNFPLEPEEYVAAAEAFMPMLPVERYPSMAGLTQDIIDGHHDGLHELSFGLEILLEGLEPMREAG